MIHHYQDMARVVSQETTLVALHSHM